MLNQNHYEAVVMNTAAEIGTVIAILAIIVAVARRAFLQPTMSIGGGSLNDFLTNSRNRN